MQKVILQLINRLMSLYEENLIKRNYKRGVWQFYNAYNISCALINYKDITITKKNKLLKRFILSPENIDSRIFKTIQKQMRKDEYIIFKAVRTLEENKEANIYDLKSYPKGTIGMLAYEFEM